MKNEFVFVRREKEVFALLKPFISQPNTEAIRFKIKSLLMEYFDNRTFRVESEE